MRASPPIEIAVSRYGWWRGAIAALVLVSAATTLGWLLASVGQIGWGFGAAAAATTLASIGLASTCLRTPPMTLRWDGQAWHLAAAGEAGGRPGELQVAVDLGPWMLLRFATQADGGRRAVVWLPVQRPGLEARWHAVRCAVHAPRPRIEPR